MTHTPGEWRVSLANQEDVDYELVDWKLTVETDNEIICVFDWEIEQNDLDNASLIASAPRLLRQNKELLEAAEGVMEWWLNDDRESIGQTERRFELLRIAIAEAKEK